MNEKEARSTTTQASAVQALQQTPEVAAMGPSAVGQSAELSGAAPAAGSKSKHYRVELKAWIPHSKVVDPEEAFRLTNRVGELADNTPLTDFDYHSHYRGDNHAGYGGGYRVLVVLDFDYDGTAITGMTKSGGYGTTHRDWDWKVTVPLIGQIASDKGTDAKTATKAMSQTATGKSFTLTMASANPLVMTMAPNIDSTLTGTFDGSGNLSLSYNTDMFPSHGIRVQRDGADILAPTIVNDASGVNALGLAGAAELGARLSLQANTGSTMVAGAFRP